MGFLVYDAEREDPYKVFTAEELSKNVYDTINYYKKRVDTLQKQNTKLINNALEIAEEQLKKENEQLRNRLKLCVVELANEKELKAYNNFVKEHEKCRNLAKINHGKAPYVIQYGVGVGTITQVRCPICNEMIDITDTGAW